MKSIVVASRNPKKAAELRALLTPLGMRVLTLDQAGVSPVLEVEETGHTFLQNAFLKANFASTATGLTSVADDSGLSVCALNGAPGIYSARYGAPEAETDADRNAFLLRQMQGMSDRRCAFVCALCLIEPYAPPRYFEGRCEGELLSAPQGQNGFGYDPLFYLPERKKTMAELPAAEKNQISHRARAMRLLAAYLAKER